MKALAQEMDKVSKETGYQPFDRMTKFDQDLYSSFKGNLGNLKKAQKMAEESMKWSYDAEKYLRNAGLWSTDDSLEKCGESNRVLDESFRQGQQECSSYESVFGHSFSIYTNAKEILDATGTVTKISNFTSNLDVVKSTNRDDMIKEVNGQAFAKTIESSFHLLEYGDPEKQGLRKKLWEDFTSNKKMDEKAYKVACSKMAAQNLCNDSIYFTQFQKGLLNAMNGIKRLEAEKSKAQELINKDPNYTGPKPGDYHPPGTFLRYDNNYVANEINSTFAKMRDICREMSEDADIYGNPDVKATWLKSYHDHFRHLQTFAGYFYDDQVRNTVNLDKWTANPRECPSDIKTNLKERLGPDAIGAAKIGFMKANEEQLKLIGDFQIKPGRGGHSNKRGARICGVTMDEKNDMYALSSLLTSHPYITGQMISAMDKSDIDQIQKKIYMSLLCEAKECSKDIQEYNQAAADAVKVTAIAASFLPIPGIQIITTATALVAEIGVQIDQYDNASITAQRMKNGALTGGFGDGYNNAVAAKIKEIELNEGSVDRLALNIAETLLQEGINFGATKAAAGLLGPVLSSALKSTKPATNVMNAIIPELQALERVAAIAEKSQLQKLIQNLEKPGVLEEIVEKSIEIHLGVGEISSTLDKKSSP